MYREIWKDIEGYEGSYQVSNKGRIMSHRRLLTFVRSGKLFTRVMRGMIMKQAVTVQKYHRIQLTQKDYRVHRLVAQAFIPNPNNLPQVNHKDFNRGNNNVKNLEWVTHQENIIHAVNGGRGVGIRKSKS